MSGLGFTMVNDPAGRSCKVMLNGTEAEFKAPRSKTVAPVQYSIMEVPEGDAKSDGSRQRGRRGRGTTHISAASGAKKKPKSSLKGKGASRLLASPAVTFVPAMSTGISLPQGPGVRTSGVGGNKSPVRKKSPRRGGGESETKERGGESKSAAPPASPTRPAKRRPPVAQRPSPRPSSPREQTRASTRQSLGSSRAPSSSLDQTRGPSPLRQTSSRTRPNPKHRIPPKRHSWNTSTAYQRPESLLWELTVKPSHEMPRARGGWGVSRDAAAKPRGKRFASAHITRCAKHRPVPSPTRTAAGGRAPAASKAGTRRQRPQSAAAKRARVRVGHRIGQEQPSITRPQPFSFALSSRLGDRSYAASYNVYNPSEACAVMYDFPDVPRRTTEEAAARLMPYSNYTRPASRGVGGRIVRHDGGRTGRDQQDRPQKAAPSSHTRNADGSADRTDGNTGAGGTQPHEHVAVGGRDATRPRSAHRSGGRVQRPGSGRRTVTPGGGPTVAATHVAVVPVGS